MAAHISIVIPVYRAEECLGELYLRLCRAVTEITQDFEIILVEDGGNDGSWKKIQELAAQDSRVRGIQLSRNFGQHYAITAGLDNCDGDWVIVMDCDLQDRPEEIPRLYRKAQEGYDVVVARRGRRHDPVLKRVTSWAFYRVFCYLADLNYDGEVGNFRIASRHVIESFCRMREKLRFFGGLMDWMGFTVGSVDVQHDERFAGSTSYTWRKLFNLALDTTLAHSDKPLRLAVKLGFYIAGFSFFYGVYLLYHALMYGTPIEGWSSIMVSLYFLGGVTISTLGMVGVYVGKTFDEAKGRPLYLIRAVSNIKPSQTSASSF